MSNELNIAANRSARKYPLAIQIKRVFWALGMVMFRLIPRPFNAPRSVLLRFFGAKVGKRANIANTATIYFPWNLEIGDWSAIGEDALIYNLGKIIIGNKTTISHRAHLCAGTHDYTKPDLPLQKPEIHVGDMAWICTDAFVGPGVTVGEGAIVGARGVAVKDVTPWTIVAGNPAKQIKKRKLYEAAE